MGGCFDTHINITLLPKIASVLKSSDVDELLLAKDRNGGNAYSCSAQHTAHQESLGAHNQTR